MTGVRGVIRRVMCWLGLHDWEFETPESLDMGHGMIMSFRMFSARTKVWCRHCGKIKD